MSSDRLLRLRREAKRQLFNYRRSAANTRACPRTPEDAEAARWVAAIDAVLAYLKSSNPVKRQVMSRLFGLETPIPRYQPIRERIIRLSMEYNVSESTIYSWREDVVQLVIFAAAEIGVARPFGISSSVDDGAKPGD